MSSPTQRSLKKLRQDGYEPGVVEKHNYFSRKKNDLFGCIDILAMPSVHYDRKKKSATKEPLLGVQATSGTNHNARLYKSMKEPRLKQWLLTGNRFQVWSWKKKGARGKRKTWQVRITEVCFDRTKGRLTCLNLSS